MAMNNLHTETQKIERILNPPSKSFFLFGPRGTGKSTLLKSKFPRALYLDLLNSQNFLKFSADPSQIRDHVASLPRGSWVILDEIQRVPALLNEVHSLYEEKKIHFALSGSSARKLKRGGENLLAGRALQTFLFPFVYKEFVNYCSIEDILEWGALPLVVTESKYKKETLASYVETYLRQELIEEALIRKLEPFIRFLRVAGIFNGQILNIENVARETKIKRTTVDHYFEILEDTLLGYRLPSYTPSLKVKEVSHPKFYFFDQGVARACAGLLEEPMDSSWKGFAFETFLLNEIRAYNHYFNKNRSIYYYKISGSYEIDCIIETRKKTNSASGEVICIEIKSSEKWDWKWATALLDFESQKKTRVKNKIGVYFGKEILSRHGVEVLPVQIFLKQLYEGVFF